MNRNSEMQSLLNSSDSTCARTFQTKYTRVEDVDLPPSRRRYHMPNLQFATLRGKSSDQKKPQSLDYSVCYNTPYREFIQKNATKRFIGVSRKIWVSVVSWIMVGIIGVLTGVVAFLINFIIKYLNQLRYGSMLSVFYQYFDSGLLILAFLTLLSFNCLFVLIAALLTGFEPLAAGSGIPEIKCYLNGIKVPHVVRLKTLIIKATGVLFSVAGGLLVGKEGPMIHSGAIIGAGVPQFRTFAVPKSLRDWKIFNYPITLFRNDKDKRDFVSAGAAAGVAAAFGAPIGGVLFALEEGCSFWNQSLTWKALFCSMCAFFGLNMLSGLAISSQKRDDLSNNHVITLIGEGLVSFGTFPQNQNLWTAKDLIVFILMGFGGGILGATFNALNKKLTIYRFKFMHRRKGFLGLCWPRIAEAVLVAIVTTMVTFLPSMLLGECSVITETWSTMSKDIIDRLDVNLTTIPCSRDGTQFNDLGTLLINPLEKTIYQLFHNPNYFSFPSLTIAFVLTFFTACWTYGTGVPSGLFVPCLMIGSIYGRLIGNVVQLLYGAILGNQANGVPFGFFIGTYALVGAASFLGGVVRMTISLAVIILESTNEILFGLPVMIALMVAKWTGDYFNEGLYDIHIHLKRMPLLEWDPPQEADLLTAKEVMSKNLTVLREHESVEYIEKVLIEKSHSGFVVVKNQLVSSYTGLSPIELNINDLTFSHGASDKTNSYTTPMERSSAEKYEPASFRGLILRSQLLAMLHYKVYNHSDKVLSHEDMIKFYPKGLNSSTLTIPDQDRHKLMDLRPYMNPSPYTALMDTCVTQVFEVFRTMGLRHLVVLDNQGRALGLITRKDLIEENLSRVLTRNNHT